MCAIIRSAALKVIRFHEARHSHAVILFKLGAHPKIVKERIGHSTETTSVHIQAHVTPGASDSRGPAL